jgi:hypothetical protein
MSAKGGLIMGAIKFLTASPLFSLKNLQGDSILLEGDLFI